MFASSLESNAVKKTANSSVKITFLRTHLCAYACASKQFSIWSLGISFSQFSVEQKKFCILIWALNVCHTVKAQIYSLNLHRHLVWIEQWYKLMNKTTFCISFSSVLLRYIIFLFFYYYYYYHSTKRVKWFKTIESNKPMNVIRVFSLNFN